MGESTAAAYLSVRMRHRIGALAIDVDFELTRPWTILFGPSGSGKTTILRAIAGLLRADSAKIVSTRERGPSLALVDTEAGVWMPPYQRCVPLAPQAASLFPHLTVLENIEYGGEGHGDPTFASLPDLFELGPLLETRPGRLSGGEAQRVNVARAAMTPGSRLLLLDEPFSGVELSLRDRLIEHLLAWQARTGTPILSVTHDVAEAFQLDAEVIKIAEGRVVAQGPASVALAEERARLLRQLSPAGETQA